MGGPAVWRRPQPATGPVPSQCEGNPSEDMCKRLSAITTLDIGWNSGLLRRHDTIRKLREDEPGFAFAKLAGADNYKKWAREMRYSLESAGMWDHTLRTRVNPRPVPILSKTKESDNIAKAERQEKRPDKIIAWKKNSSICNGYFSRMCVNHNQQVSSYQDGMESL
ncbi:hypothetical protein MMC22_005775 [Lobaria immixta]|nr:hypothetical protein [Lobaria immixta]